MDGDIVEEGTVEVTYIIRAWDQDDGTRLYDWIAAEESDELYRSIDEARKDAISSLEF